MPKHVYVAGFMKIAPCKQKAFCAMGFSHVKMFKCFIYVEMFSKYNLNKQTIA